MTRFVILMACLSLLLACEPNKTFERNISIPEAKWAHSNPLDISVTIPDTAVNYDLYLTIRHTTDYPFENLWLNITTTYPSGNSGTLRKQIYLGDNEEGHWNGECIRDICLAQIPIVEGHHFSETGEYHFEIEHIMRTDPLPEILDVGLRIEKEAD